MTIGDGKRGGGKSRARPGGRPGKPGKPAGKPVPDDRPKPAKPVKPVPDNRPGAARRPSRVEPDASVAASYEGPEILSALLSRAGCPLSASEVANRFAGAQQAGEARAAAIPGLFRAEPKFASPEEARRLFQNLFGLWERVDRDGAAAVAVGEPSVPDAMPLPSPDAPPLPERGTTPGDRVTPGTVEAVWQHLAGLPAHELRRVRHRFESSQPDLVAWLAAVSLPESGVQAALDLVLEAWAMLDRAFGDRLGRASWKVLTENAQEPPPLEANQPALAAYVAEQLDLLSDEDVTFGPEERAQVERVVATAAAALARTLE